MEQEQLVSILQKFVAKNKRQLEKYKRFQDQMINEKEEAVKKITEDENHNQITNIQKTPKS